jgi:rhodanese-related sulfurtransferase
MNTFLLKLLVLGAAASGAAVAHSWVWNDRVMLRGETSLMSEAVEAVKGDGAGQANAEAARTSPKVMPDKAAVQPETKPEPTASGTDAGSTIPTPMPTNDAVPKPPVIKDKADISIADAAALHTNGDGLTFFIDAREPHEFFAGHIEGSMSIPASVLRRGRPQKVADNLPEIPVVVVYCGGGDCHASEDVADFLRQWVKSIGVIRIMHAGYPEWAKAGLPIGTGADPYGE